MLHGIIVSQFTTLSSEEFSMTSKKPELYMSKAKAVKSKAILGRCVF